MKQLTTEEEKAKQAQVQKDKSSCDHIGYFVGFGMEVITSHEGVNVLAAENCMMCGEVVIKLTTLQSKKSESKILS